MELSDIALFRFWWNDTTKKIKNGNTEGTMQYDNDIYVALPKRFSPGCKEKIYRKYQAVGGLRLYIYKNNAMIDIPYHPLSYKRPRRSNKNGETEAINVTTNHDDAQQDQQADNVTDIEIDATQTPPVTPSSDIIPGSLDEPNEQLDNVFTQIEFLGKQCSVSLQTQEGLDDEDNKETSSKKKKVATRPKRKR